MSKTKIEQRAITKFRDIIDNIELFTYRFSEMDKDISWDGNINMFHGNVDIKNNFDSTIDVQIKGRTTSNKHLKEKHKFQLDRSDLENYLKKDGTLLLLCLFKSNGNEFKTYYSKLLPYNIRFLLKTYSTTRIKINMKEIISPNHFEEICRNFNLDRQMQKGVNAKIFKEGNLIANDAKVAKMYLWNKEPKNFKPQNLLGTWKYIYTLDENGYTINISYGELTNIVENLNTKIYDANKKIIFDNVKLETLVDGQKILFGKAFTIDLKKKIFNIKINGTLFERIKQLEFTRELFKNSFFLINNVEFKILPPSEKEKIKFKELLNKYIAIREFLIRHNVSKDICLDDWTNEDFNKLIFWINAIDDNKLVNLESDTSLIGSISIKDIKLSIFAKINKNKKFEVQSLWNNNLSNKYNFKYQSDEEEIETNNLYLALNSESYQSDDVNIDEMKETFKNKNMTDGEYTLMNLQVLEIIKAYDIVKREELLQYAKYLTKILLKHEQENPVYKINYFQILKRKNELTEKQIDEIINLRDNSDEIEIKIGCNLLIDNKKETKFLIKKLNTETIEVFKQYPISIYMD